VNIVKVDTVPVIEAFRNIVPKKHLIGKASLPLCFTITFTCTMSRPMSGTKLAASSKPTSLLFGTFYEEERMPTWILFSDCFKSADGQFGVFSFFDYNEDNGGGYSK
jgi:hypothetical protein